MKILSCATLSYHSITHRNRHKYTDKMPCCALLGLLFLPVLIVLKRQWFRKLWKRITRDFTALKSILIMVIEMKKVVKENMSVHKRFEGCAKRHPNKAALLFEDETWTFAQVEELQNKVAIYFEQIGFKQGDCVTLLLHNCPEYVSIWLGLSKIGIRTALLNTNLGIDSLKHSIRIVNSKAIIFGACFQELVTSTIIPEFSLKGYQFNRPNESTQAIANCINLIEEIKPIDATQPLKNTYTISLNDPLLYIYTSGTTGLSKAAIVNHLRYSLFRCAAKILFMNLENPVIYCPMPLYHGSGVALGVGQMVLSGNTVALRKKFSASNYWKDCKKYKCTAAQYIGEMLRYVLMAHTNEEVDYSLDLIYGNGLKPEVWGQFIEKYKVKRVVEFYAATEGTFGLYNVDNTLGNTGYIPPYFRKFFPMKLVRFSEECGEPIRDENGFCILCKENEPGLAIGKVDQKKKLSHLLNFTGYTDTKESSRKLLNDVFKKCDCYFNSGDLLSFDEEGYFYFIDRIGDTFRWKGENVSTTEIESIVSKIIGLNDAVVYGVQIPGTEGRAGMVSLVDPDKNLNLDILLEKFKENIASYAVPIFIRVINDVPITSTFKLQKFNLRSEGFNVNVIKDPMYFYDDSVKKYVLLTKDIYDSIMAGKSRL